MSKRLKAPRYVKLIAYLEGVMQNSKESDKSRMAAALRLDDLYARLETEDGRVAAHKRRIELRALQVSNPTLPLPASEEDTAKTAERDRVFNSVLNGGTDVSS